MAKGDLAVCYASVWQSVFAVVEITSAPEEDPELERWRWSFSIRPLVALDDLDRSIAAEEVGIFPSSVWRHSYIRLGDEQFAAASAAVERAARRVWWNGARLSRRFAKPS